MFDAAAIFKWVVLVLGLLVFVIGGLWYKNSLLNSIHKKHQQYITYIFKSQEEIDQHIGDVSNAIRGCSEKFNSKNQRINLGDHCIKWMRSVSSSGRD